MSASPKATKSAKAAVTKKAASKSVELESVEIRSVGGLIEALGNQSSDEVFWYRGHTDVSHKLIPSLARPPCKVDAELTLLKRFQQNAYPFLKWRPDNEWDWLFLMQHHGVPTRLLDWSESPLIALWFAMNPPAVPDDDVDACVWALRPIELNLLANLAPKYKHDIPLFGQDKELDNYLPTDLANTIAKNTPAAGIASRQFSRVVAQMGSFTITHKDQVPLEELGRGLTRFVIPADAKEGVRRELLHLRITRLSVFPELANVTEIAQEGLWL